MTGKGGRASKMCKYSIKDTKGHTILALKISTIAMKIRVKFSYLKLNVPSGEEIRWCWLFPC